MSTHEELQAMWEEEAAAAAKGDDTQATPAEETPPEQTASTESEPQASAPEQTSTDTPAVDPTEELRSHIAQLQDRLRKTEGHIGGLTSELKRTKDALAAGTAAAQQTQGEAPTSTQMQTAAKTPEAWEKLKADFPEWAEGIEAYMATRQPGAQAAGITPEQMQERLQQQEATLRAEMATRVNEMFVETRHEGWKDTVKTPEFAAWAQVQSPEIKALAASDNPADAVRMLDLYKKSTETPATSIATDRQSRLAASATPRGEKVAPRKGVADMTPEELWDYEANRRAKANQSN